MLYYILKPCSAFYGGSDFGSRVSQVHGLSVSDFGVFFGFVGLGKFPLVCNFHKGSTQACCEAFS